MKTLMKLLVMGSFLMLTVISCKKDPSPPAIPPASTMAIDFGDFNSTKSLVATDSVIPPASNWGYCAAGATFWNIILTVTLAVPVASFYESFKHEGAYQSENTWVWAYSFTAIFKYNAKLTAKAVGDSIHWEMRISQQGGFQDVVWYTGVSAKDGSKGNWTLNENALNPTKFIYIEWNRDQDIKYTLVKAADPNVGAYIKYGKLATGNFNAFYQIYLYNNLTDIEWNTTTKDGHVKDPNAYGDSEWHCWSTSLQNTTCN